MPVVGDKSFRLLIRYFQEVSAETVGNRLKQLWDILDQARKDAILDLIRSDLGNLVSFNSSGSAIPKLKDIAALLTNQEANLVFGIMRNDLVAKLEADKTNFINKTDTDIADIQATNLGD